MANSEKLGTKKVSEKQEKENIVTKILSFFNKNQNVIYGTLVALLVVACVIIVFNRFYIKKKNENASAQIVQPITLFRAGDTNSLNLALEGDDENDGFLTIINNYKLTRTANVARYYAGLCYLKLGQKDDALDYLKKFRKKEDVLWYACQATIGDLYDDEGDETTAIRYYKKAIKGKDPYFTPIALFKLAQMYERQDNWTEALKSYQTIETRFYSEFEKMGIAQYRERAKSKME